MMGRRRNAGFPWHLWAALLALAMLLLSALWLFPPAFEISRPRLVWHGANCAAEFEATNHTRAPIAQTVRVTFLRVAPATKNRRALYEPLGHFDLVVALAPGEKRPLSCEIATTDSALPNLAEAAILPDSP